MLIITVWRERVHYTCLSLDVLYLHQDVDEAVPSKHQTKDINSRSSSSSSKPTITVSQNGEDPHQNNPAKKYPIKKLNGKVILNLIPQTVVDVYSCLIRRVLRAWHREAAYPWGQNGGVAMRGQNRPGRPWHRNVPVDPDTILAIIIHPFSKSDEWAQSAVLKVQKPAVLCIESILSCC